MYFRLKQLREQKKLTQPQMADVLCVALSTYRSYENGSREPNIDILIKLSDFYEVSIDYILDHTPQKPTFNAEEVAHIKKFRSLDRYGKKAVAQLLETETERCVESEMNVPKTVTVQYAARSPDSQGAGTRELNAEQIEALNNAPNHLDDLD